jgi:hypothetical protein
MYNEQKSPKKAQFLVWEPQEDFIPGPALPNVGLYRILLLKRYYKNIRLIFNYRFN